MMIVCRCRDGVLFEKGPRTVRPAGPQGANTLALVQVSLTVHMYSEVYMCTVQCTLVQYNVHLYSAVYTKPVLQELGLADAVRPVTYDHPSSTNRMILVQGQLHRLPSR